MIDVTNYYALARAGQFFPGQLGYWNNVQVGFASADPASKDPTEQHAIYNAAMIFESHGPFRVALGINRFNVYVAPQPLP